MNDFVKRERERREHVAAQQPHHRLFTVSLTELRRRAASAAEGPSRKRERVS